ncbi:hypothetical protein [Kitasatospora sp. NPDC089509]|uniref:hypothetical protein n=1 Tax=Kitasatospora sp. NPDC089509 TaxID=3364079 RepID=UPI0038253B06
MGSSVASADVAAKFRYRELCRAKVRDPDPVLAENEPFDRRRRHSRVREPGRIAISPGSRPAALASAAIRADQDTCPTLEGIGPRGPSEPVVSNGRLSCVPVHPDIKSNEQKPTMQSSGVIPTGTFVLAPEAAGPATASPGRTADSREAGGFTKSLQTAQGGRSPAQAADDRRETTTRVARIRTAIATTTGTVTGHLRLKAFRKEQTHVLLSTGVVTT